MSELRLRPRGVTEIIDAAFSLYKRDASDYILVGAVAYTPSLLVQLIQVANPENFIGNAVLTLLAALVSIVTYSLMTGVLVKLGATAYLGGEPDVANTVRDVLPRLPTLILSSIIKGISVFIGLIFLIVPGVYLALRFFAVEQAVVLEGAHTMQAFDRSGTLSEGLKGHVFGTLFLAYLLYFLLSIGLLAIVGVAALVTSPVLLLVLSTTMTILVYPMIGLTQMVLYYDTRIRREGFDLEAMAGAIDSLPA